MELSHTYIVFDPAAHTDPKTIFRMNATPEPLLLNGLHFFIFFWGQGLTMGVRAARSKTGEAEVPTRPAKCGLVCPHRPPADGNSGGAKVFANSLP